MNASRIVRPNTAFAATSRRLKYVRVRAEDHLKFVRSLPCVVTGRTTEIDAAHVSYRDLRYGKIGRGIGQKEADIWTVPLWHTEHMAQHDLGNEGRYWREHGIDACRVAVSLWACSGDYETALIVIREARAP